MQRGGVLYIGGKGLNLDETPFSETIHISPKPKLVFGLRSMKVNGTCPEGLASFKTFFVDRPG